MDRNTEKAGMQSILRRYMGIIEREVDVLNYLNKSKRCISNAK